MLSTPPARTRSASPLRTIRAAVATTPLGAAPVFRATPVNGELVALEGRLADGTLTVRCTAGYRPRSD